MEKRMETGINCWVETDFWEIFWTSAFYSKSWEKWWMECIDLLFWCVSCVSRAIRLCISLEECALIEFFKCPFGEIQPVLKRTLTKISF